MKRKFSILIVGIVIIGVALGLAGITIVSQAASQPQMARKIVVFQSGMNEPAKEALLKNFGGEKIKDLPLVNGMAVLLSPQAEKSLVKQAGVLRIDNDDEVFILDKPVIAGKPPKEPVPQPPQTLSWGVGRIDADSAWIASNGAGVKVAIIDTGIDIDHLDLAVAGGVNVVGPFKTEKYNDDNGHGTHVAGIVAALDNTIGVVGVAPGAQLYAVKAFNRKAIGFDSDIIDGIDWSITNGMQVINMSFGGSDNPSLHQAIQAAYNAGIVMVAAAGNNGTTDGKIVYPAKYSETIAVSATNITDGLAYFSSYGPEIDLAAPGEKINSTWNDGYYKEGSGTSMATPHVVGTVALVLADPYLKCDTDLNGSCSPDEVKIRLEATAEWLPALTSDQQGSGLVDAENAVNLATQ